MPDETSAPELPIRLDLPDDTVLTVRQVTVDDVDDLMELYAGLGSLDRHRRFFSQFTAHREWVEEWIARATGRGFGLVAALERHGTSRIVGEAVYVLQDSGNGEFSLTVDQEWRGWLGPYLLDVLTEVAASRGVANLEAEILTENTPMRAVVRRRNAVVAGSSDATVQHVVFGTRDRQATWPRAGRDTRVLVEVPGGHWLPAREAERAGYEVLGCPGPDRRCVTECPMRSGHPCPLAAAADVIVVAVPPGSEQAAWLATTHARLHPDVPVLVIGDGPAAEAAPGACHLASASPAAVIVDHLDRLVQARRAGDDVRRRAPTP